MHANMFDQPSIHNSVILLSTEFEYNTILKGFEILVTKSGSINISVSINLVKYLCDIELIFLDMFSQFLWK